MNSANRFDVIVVGGGHAGTEAALACARMGAQTLLLTQSIDTLGQMSCNPAIGGIGKGHLVKEIDALGGAMARATDLAGIQFRTLNRSKGPAVRATRVQADRLLYRKAIREMLENQPNLYLFQQSVDDLIIDNNQIQGVVTQMGLAFYAKSVVLTVGTFLGGKIHIGQNQTRAGRAGDPPSLALAEKLRALPFRVGRLKTGTPPRIDGRTINYANLQRQEGDSPLPLFSPLSSIPATPQQLPCFITHTSEQTHQVIRQNLALSAMYSGAIEGIGPRYCPSIEDKIVRFADKSSHQIFIEPEGLNTHEIYPNGISTSLPFAVQQDFVRTIIGFESAHITRPGYAIEYDFFDPRDLHPWLETKNIQGLFFAGQINGTTGYEEAAAQGLIAGINATRKIQSLAPWWPKREEAYIGVLLDDLMTCGTTEPYRMFTSRAEYRLLLREDNASLRLTEIGYQMGLVSEAQWRHFNEYQAAIAEESTRLANIVVQPDSTPGLQLAEILGQPLAREFKALELLKRPELDYAQLMQLTGLGPATTSAQVAQQVEVTVKYAGYIDRQQIEIGRLARYEETLIPSDFDYTSASGLSTEVRQKLTLVRPTTLGMASRIPGVTPAAISLLLVHLKKRHVS